jgi:hypothetical protein
MTPDDEEDATSPAEQHLLSYLRSLREDPPEPDRAVAAAILRKARWQAAVRPFAVAAGRLIAGMGDSARVMAGRAGA